MLLVYPLNNENLYFFISNNFPWRQYSISQIQKSPKWQPLANPSLVAGVYGLLKVFHGRASLFLPKKIFGQPVHHYRIHSVAPVCLFA